MIDIINRLYNTLSRLPFNIPLLVPLFNTIIILFFLNTIYSLKTFNITFNIITFTYFIINSLILLGLHCNSLICFRLLIIDIFSMIYITNNINTDIFHSYLIYYIYYYFIYSIIVVYYLFTYIHNLSIVSSFIILIINSSFYIGVLGLGLYVVSFLTSANNINIYIYIYFSHYLSINYLCISRINMDLTCFLITSLVYSYSSSLSSFSLSYVYHNIKYIFSSLFPPPISSSPNSVLGRTLKGLYPLMIPGKETHNLG